MPLKYKVDSLDDVDENARDLYTKTESGYVLDVEGVPDGSGAKKALAAERERAKKAEREAKEAQRLAEELRRQAEELGVSEEEVEEFRKFRESKETEDERAERIRREATKPLEAKLQGATQQLEQLQEQARSYRERYVNREVEAALAAAVDAELKPVNPRARQLFIEDLRKLVSVNVDDETATVSLSVLDENGNERFDADGQPMTPAALARGFTKIKVYEDFLASERKAGGGAPSGNVRDEGPGNTGATPPRDREPTAAERQMQERREKIARFREEQRRRAS